MQAALAAAHLVASAATSIASSVNLETSLMQGGEIKHAQTETPNMSAAIKTIAPPAIGITSGPN